MKTTDRFWKKFGEIKTSFEILDSVPLSRETQQVTIECDTPEKADKIIEYLKSTNFSVSRINNRIFVVFLYTDEGDRFDRILSDFD